MELFKSILQVASYIVGIGSFVFFVYLTARGITNLNRTLTYVVKVQTDNNKIQGETNKKHDESINSINELIKLLFKSHEATKQQFVEIRQLIMDQRGDEAKKAIECDNHHKATELHSKKIATIHKNVKKIATKIDIQIDEL